MPGTLVLVRHAKSGYPVGVDDHDRPLAERGERDAAQIGLWLAASVSDPGTALVLVSTAERAQSTWRLAHENLGSAWATATQMAEPRIYEASVHELLAIACEPSDGFDTVVMVGHNPGMAGLVAHLAVPQDLVDRGIDRFRTSSVAVLSVPPPWRNVGPGCAVRDFVVARG